MTMREFGRIYQPVYRDKKTREQKHSPTWWIAYYYRGTEHRESSESTDSKVARRLLKKRIGEMGRGAFVGPNADKVTLEDLCSMVRDDYAVNSRKSIERLGSAVTHLKDGLCAQTRALDLTADRINGYIRTRQDAHAMPATIRYELAVLKRAFTLAVRAGKLSSRPYIPSIAVRNTRTGFFSREDYEKVLKSLPNEVQGAITFAYLSGWRIKSEILPVQWRQVDLKAGVVRLEPGTTKNDEGRTFPFATIPELAEVLQQQRAYTDQVQKETGSVIPWVFHRRGRPIRSMRKSFATACTAAGVPGRIPHDFRRTAVRNLERAGVPRSVAMKLVGHKTEAIYRRYAIVSESDLMEGVKKLATLHGQVAEDASASVVSLETRKAHGKQAVAGR